MGLGRDTRVLSRLAVACMPKGWPAGGSQKKIQFCVSRDFGGKVVTRCDHPSSFHNKVLHTAVSRRMYVA
jgi:hypothetical protein